MEENISQLTNAATRTSSKHKLSEDGVQEGVAKRRRTDLEFIDSPRYNDLTTIGITRSPLTLRRLPTGPIVPSRPHTTQNMFGLYKLDSLAASVARRDPVTSEKINALRKSYKGKVKDFPGKNDAVDKERELFDLLTYPDEDWTSQQVHGHLISDTFARQEKSLSAVFLDRLNPAISLCSGPLPALIRDNWRTIIDLECGSGTTRFPDTTDERAFKVPTNSNPDTLDDLQRPKRRSTARSYQDDAFEGYAEGYADDFGDEISLDGDEERRNALMAGPRRKRRKKDVVSSSHFGYSSIPQYSASAVSAGGHIQ